MSASIELRLATLVVSLLQERDDDGPDLVEANERLTRALDMVQTDRNALLLQIQAYAPFMQSVGTLLGLIEKLDAHARMALPLEAIVRAANTCGELRLECFGKPCG